MSPVAAVTEVFDAIQRAKAGASAFCTNFFPVQAKLQSWVDHGELYADLQDGVAFFLRKDRDFWHLYYGATNASSLRREIIALSALKSERVAVDLVGREASLGEAMGIMESAGFGRHSRLLRLARAGQQPEPQAPTPVAEARWAERQDCPGIMTLLEESFDRYADQLPALYEIEAAVAAQQVLAIKRDETVAAFLYFERQGLTSTVRYWVVAPRFRSERLGSQVMRQYFAVQPGVRRFILWVTANNDDAVAKYRHYGYAPDGLIDHVLVNQLILK